MSLEQYQCLVLSAYQCDTQNSVLKSFFDHINLSPMALTILEPRASTLLNEQFQALLIALSIYVSLCASHGLLYETFREASV